MDNKKEKFDFFEQKLTRREFIKKSAIGIGALAFGAYTIKGLLMRPHTYMKDRTFRDKAPSELWKWSKEARFYTKLQNNEINCNLCPHNCYLLPDDRGFCRTCVNKNGKLYSITYGNPCSVHIDPIEKKPLFHFLPGTKAFSLSTAGCNLRCLFCQNWEISQFEPEETNNIDLMPDKTVYAVLYEKNKDSSVKTITYTYGEPVAYYDYMLDTAKIAKQNNIKNVVITAGYINEEPLKELAKTVDAIKIDLKGFNENFYRKVTSSELSHTLNAIKTTYKNSWLEIVNLIVPTLNDDMEEIKQMAEWLKSVNKDIPLHFSRFSPQFKLPHLPPTPMETLLKAREVALDAGLNYVYIGNVPHGDYENTYCPKCKQVVIERYGYFITKYLIKDGKCTVCEEKIAGVFA